MKNKIRKSDLILIGAVIAVGLILALVLLFSRSTGAKVQIRVDGKVTQTFPLSIDREYIIEGVNGGTNELVISGGTAEVKEASCPDALCVHMGKIRYNGESIICLPNKVVVEVIDGENDDDDLDIVAGGKQG